MKTHTVAEVKVFSAYIKEKGRRVKISAFTNTRQYDTKKIKKSFLRFV
jgi:hypothetical protein